MDPLAGKYPWYTPYSFSGNKVIAFVELEGLEESKNPKEKSISGNVAKKEITKIGESSNLSVAILNGKEALYDKLILTNCNFCTVNGGGYGDITTENGKDYVSDVPKDESKLNMYVHKKGAAVVAESDKYNNYNNFVANRLLQNFISGEGPENYIFPTDGIISRSFINSRIVKKALKEFKDRGDYTYRSSFGLKDLVINTRDNGTPFNVAGLVGSGTITIVTDGDNIKVTIFNVTSLTSGAFMSKVISKMPFVDDKFGWPISYVREEGKITPFGNISQTYSFTMPNPNNN